MESNSPSVLCLGKTVLFTENLRTLRSVTSLNALLPLLALGWMKRAPFGFQESSIRPYIITNMSDLPCQNELRYVRPLWSGDSVTYGKYYFPENLLKIKENLKGKETSIGSCGQWFVWLHCSIYIQRTRVQYGSFNPTTLQLLSIARSILFPKSLQNKVSHQLTLSWCIKIQEKPKVKAQGFHVTV